MLSENLTDLWAKYKAINVKYLFCLTVKTNRNWRVFNPGWQKRDHRVVKGRMLNREDKTKTYEIPIDDADKPIWLVS